MSEAPPEFASTTEPSMHIDRAREIFSRHPEVKSLMGPNPLTAVWIVALVAVQWTAAALLHDVSWWWIPLAAYGFGAFVNHALYVLIHESTHNLVFRNAVANRIMGIVCDFALVIPGALAFRKYHLLHHQFLGNYDEDPDIVSDVEGRMVGHSPWRKALWVLLLGLSQALRPLKITRVGFVDRWIIANIAAVVIVDAAIFYLFGVQALVYLALSTLFALGLHPVGGRWIQEHYATSDDQETYSYYGPLNRLCFNMGYHVEHHDFASIPWNNLPRLRRLAPEAYDGLKSYRSWTGVLVRFIFDPAMSTYSRIVRTSKAD